MAVSTTRRQFLKGLGALALLALPACRRAQEYAVVPEGCPEWVRSGEATAFATSMPWASGAVPLLALCHGGLPTSLVPNPHAVEWSPGLPALVQAALLDLYDPRREQRAMFNGEVFPMEGVRGALRGWSQALREGLRVALLLPGGRSAVRVAQLQELRGICPSVRCFSWDPVEEPRPRVFAALERQQRAGLGEAVRFENGYEATGERALVVLTDLLRRGELDLLLVMTPADPAAHSPAFAEALRVTEAATLRLCLRRDVTAGVCQYTVPQTHFLEEWGADADGYGHWSLRQPITLPLVPAFSEAEVLDALVGGGDVPVVGASTPFSPARDWVVRALGGGEALEGGLRRGLVPGAPLPVALPVAPEGVPYLHPWFVDGRFLHNAWLREVYDTLSGCAGLPAVFVPGGGGQVLGEGGAVPGEQVPEEQVLGGWRVAGWHLPCVRVPEVEQGVLPMLPGIAAALSVARMPGEAASAPELPVQRPHAAPELAEEPCEPVQGASPQWGMRVAFEACIGCQACTVACRAENNVPTVGAEQQRMGRDLQWLRIDRYLDRSGGVRFFLPTACRQCENAPCESVCPVNATVHTAAGLNAMVYPRCWGTRYCAAACPYLARTFNFYDYAREAYREQKLPPNPAVTVRSRGVMEKCTYCVQRINAAKVSGERPRAACEQACPVGAIRLLDLVREPIGRAVVNFDAAQTRPRTRYVRG